MLNLSSWCLVMVEWLYLAVPWGCLRFVIVVFPDHTHLLFFTEYTYPQFQNSQEFAFDGGVIFDTLANSNEFHADVVVISALECSI